VSITFVGERERGVQTAMPRPAIAMRGGPTTAIGARISHFGQPSQGQLTHCAAKW
jgi:hypothetical protein